MKKLDEQQLLSDEAAQKLPGHVAPRSMNPLGQYWVYIGIMENKMETIGIIGIIRKAHTPIMENQMEQKMENEMEIAI